MRQEYLRELREFAAKYGLHLVNVQNVFTESDVSIAIVAIMQLDSELTRTGRRYGITVALPYTIAVSARRTNKAWKRINRTN